MSTEIYRDTDGSILLKYSPDQPRDDHGRFGEGNGKSSREKAMNRKAAKLAARASNAVKNRSMEERAVSAKAEKLTRAANANKGSLKERASAHTKAINAHLKAYYYYRKQGNQTAARAHDNAMGAHWDARTGIRSRL